MSEKVLLTGISGFVAKHVAIELLNSDYEVLGTVRNSNSVEQTKKTLEENKVSTEKYSWAEIDTIEDLERAKKLECLQEPLNLSSV